MIKSMQSFTSVSGIKTKIGPPSGAFSLISLFLSFLVCVCVRTHSGSVDYWPASEFWGSVFVLLPNSEITSMPPSHLAFFFFNIWILEIKLTFFTLAKYVLCQLSYFPSPEF